MQNQINIKSVLKSITTEYLSSYLLYEPNSALRAFTVAPELQLHISDLKAKIFQNVKFSSVSQTNDLILKLNLTRQHESRGMLGFQNIVPNIKLLKFHVNRDNRAYLEKCEFQQKLVYQI